MTAHSGSPSATLTAVEAGMSPLDALRSATIEAARMLDLQEDVGTLEPGKYADIVAARANPLEDFRVRSMVLVMEGGRVYRSELE